MVHRRGYDVVKKCKQVVKDADALLNKDKQYMRVWF